MAHATKPTMNTFGTFSTPSYVTVGDPYQRKAKKDTKMKGKPQMMTTSTKGKSGTMEGYFGKEYARPFEKEPLSEPIKIRRKQELSKRKKMIGPNYKPTGPAKSIASPGSYQGTFNGKIEYFSTAKTKTEKYKKEPRNFLTNPAKKGGAGYLDVTIGKLPEYKSSPFDASSTLAKKDAAKHKALMKAGPFKATAPAQPEGTSGLFDQNPYRQPTKTFKKKSEPPQKKVTVPFYPTKPPPTMGASGHATGTFHKLEYTPEKPKPKEKARSVKVFRPVSNVKGGVTKSLISSNIMRSANLTRTINV